jgi:hypothetical protein
MRFFRRRSSPGLVALLAFAMQAALVLAQTHDHSHVHTQAGARAWAQSVQAMACRAVVHPGCAPIVPHDHRSDCPLCWSIAAAGAAVLPTALAVTHEVPSFGVLQPQLAAAGLPGTDTVHFQARAPPLA